jgi:hypothetical protein
MKRREIGESEVNGSSDLRDLREDFAMARRRILSSLGLSIMVVACVARDARPQTTLDRLEKQVRERVGQQPTPPPPKPGITASAPNPEAAESPGQGDKREPGYLGLMADDQKDRGRGVRVLNVAADGPAAKGGLKKQDLITAVAGVRTRQMTEMSDVLDRYAAGESVEIDLLRDNKPQKIKVTLGGRPQNSAAVERGEPVPTPPGEAAGSAAAPEGSKKSSMLDFFRLKSTNPVEKKSTPLSEGEPSATVSPNGGDEAAQPSVEQLEKRIAELERRVAALEKALAEIEKEKSQ